jgi:CBS domain-containing protein
MIVADLMTREVPSCRIGDTLNQAAQLMWEARRGAVAVLDDGQRVVGVLTDRDACMSAYTQGARMSDIPVSTAMSSSIVACAPSASIEEAENLMMSHDVRRLVVVDLGERLLGMLSLDDIAADAISREGLSAAELRRIALTVGEIARHTRGPAPEPNPVFTALPQSSLDTFETPRAPTTPTAPFAVAKPVAPTAASHWRVGNPPAERPKF